MFWHVSVHPSINLSREGGILLGGTLPGGTLQGVYTVGGTLPGIFCQAVYPAGGVPFWGIPYLDTPWARTVGGTQVGYPPGRVPPQARTGGTQVGYPPGRVPHQARTGGGTQLGQQKEYSLHGRRYASCVHAGGLSCLWVVCSLSRVQIR